MRIDKYLKISRLIKRRTVAKEACDKGRVLVNNRPAKAGTDVTVGDEIVIRFGNSELKVKVAELDEKTATKNTRKEDASSLYEVISRTDINESGDSQLLD